MTASDTPAPPDGTPPARRLPTRLVMIVFVAIFGMLALGYMLFLRADYAPVFTGLRAGDAAAIVAQLEAKNIAYRLGDGGGTILVPVDQADQARLAIAGSDIALKGGVGFELFNKSDMGLTDFAQRINYQRALQGELERSIDLLEEVDSARVHLALPERTIFRSERSNAKAAVELVFKPGRAFDDARVAGVQRLVAFAVPDLAPADVVILDGGGHILSQAAADTVALSPDAEEQQSLQTYYRARARAAIERILPGLAAEVKVIALPRDGERPAPAVAPSTVPTSAPASPASNTGSTPPSAAPDAPVTPPTAVVATAAPTAAGSVRNFRLRVIVSTAARLNDEDQTLVRNAVIAALALDDNGGDELAFEVGMGAGGAPASGAVAPGVAPTPGTGSFRVPAAAGLSWSAWLAIALAMMLGLVLVVPRLGARRARLTPAERDAMVERLRHALRQEGDGHAAA